MGIWTTAVAGPFAAKPSATSRAAILAYEQRQPSDAEIEAARNASVGGYAAMLLAASAAEMQTAPAGSTAAPRTGRARRCVLDAALERLDARIEVRRRGDVAAGTAVRLTGLASR